MIKRFKISFSTKLFPTTWISLLLTILLLPMSLTLPAWWGWENGPVENTQVFILCIGLILTWFAARYNRNDRKIRNLWLGLTPFWLLCIGRELSWGRVFYTTSIGRDGPEFISIHQLWYGQWVYPIVAVVIVALILGICFNSPWNYIRKTPMPLVDMIILLIMTVLASIFDKATIAFLHPHEEILEEWAELTAYWSLISIVAIIGFKNKLTRID